MKMDKGFLIEILQMYKENEQSLTDVLTAIEEYIIQNGTSLKCNWACEVLGQHNESCPKYINQAEATSHSVKDVEGVHILRRLYLALKHENIEESEFLLEAKIAAEEYLDEDKSAPIKIMTQKEKALLDILSDKNINKEDLHFLKERYVLRLIKKRGKIEALRLYPECALFINQQ